jgi:hypothetical protein
LLIIAEVALTLLLLSSAALVLKSFARATSVQLGFDPRGLVSAQLYLPSPPYEDAEKLTNLTEQLLQKLRAVPGVENAAGRCKPTAPDRLADELSARRHTRTAAGTRRLHRGDGGDGRLLRDHRHTTPARPHILA